MSNTPSEHFDDPGPEAGSGSSAVAVAPASDTHTITEQELDPEGYTDMILRQALRDLHDEERKILDEDEGPADLSSLPSLQKKVADALLRRMVTHRSRSEARNGKHLMNLAAYDVSISARSTLAVMTLVANDAINMVVDGTSAFGMNKNVAYMTGEHNKRIRDLVTDGKIDDKGVDYDI